ncbi:hypothetical protein BU14_0098s0011 [Porphyra umbilicalis]|uniref:Uncharacterized protein n=1 Tax=Porphyra umbilicalis TaxID=2786 RepID=A0A1X6PDJ4_PORUM|nr:hypothetical protein BU14_0098s0011 [Porphyra umbilicalis]|eukprot:OSX78785.1 hypothetical protein BU14_0098s0011 [Porphyra umbilicalis]
MAFLSPMLTASPAVASRPLARRLLGRRRPLPCVRPRRTGTWRGGGRHAATVCASAGSPGPVPPPPWPMAMTAERRPALAPRGTAWTMAAPRPTRTCGPMASARCRRRWSTRRGSHCCTLCWRRHRFLATRAPLAARASASARASTWCTRWGLRPTRRRCGGRASTIGGTWIASSTGRGRPLRPTRCRRSATGTTTPSTRG